ncbi:hypothetical protein VTJ83DRAFT_1224 [Remersonia thermophila]|uniref:DUF803 domain membrane protein n=1 Tax=Remersonia thermophila TaxID=72144 RepID=A0ABR4DNG0_9PEZI
MRLPLSSSAAPLPEHAWPAWLPDTGDSSGGRSSSSSSSSSINGGDNGNGGNPEDELQNWSSLIGIITAICGNILIALALNVQRYAHIRLHRRRREIRERARQALKNSAASEGRYGAAGASSRDQLDGTAASLPLLSNAPNGSRNGLHADDRSPSETNPLAQSFQSDSSGGSSSGGTAADAADVKRPASSYLKDPYWWLGQVLITIGELGNFLAYGFAPASIVSPLGVVALISNCIIAPIFFKEVFRPRDFWGVLIAVLGAVTVVLSAKTEETKLGPHDVWDAITTIEFEIYMAVTAALMALLMWLSPRYGSRTILVDLGLVGLFGGYTALSTKGVSSMLSSTLLGAFTTPVTYALIFVLLFTAIMQVRYVNKALQRFDSTQVIPVQFVLFTLCVIIGSAVLFRDFERTTGEQAIKFIGGCLFTFFGVFIITSGRPRQTDDEDEVTLSDAEGIEETIGLAEHGRRPSWTSQGDGPRTPAGSRRSSRASRTADAARPLAALFSQGYRSAKGLRTAPSRRTLLVDGEDDGHDDEHAPLLGNPWHGDHSPTQPSRLRAATYSTSPPALINPPTSHPSADGEEQEEGEDSDADDDTILAATAASATSSSASSPVKSKRILRKPSQDATAAAATTTPHLSLPAADRSSRPSTPIRPPTQHFYSPSPFSGTLNAVVGELRAAMDEGILPDQLPSGSGSGMGIGLNLNLNLPFGFGAPGLSGAAAAAAAAASSTLTSSPKKGRARGGSTASMADPGNGLHELDENGGDGNLGHGISAAAEGGGAERGMGGFRGRARSLSQSLGLGSVGRGWFGGPAAAGGDAAARAGRMTAGARLAALVRRNTSDDQELGSRSAGGRGERFGGVLERARTVGHA